VVEREDGDLLRELRDLGGGFQRLVLTRNRRVVASVVDGGATLRLHRALAAAPREVLRALLVALGPPMPGARDAARRVVRGFLASLPPEPVRRRVRRTGPTDEPHLTRLRAEFDAVNAAFFDGELPTVPLHLSGRMHRRNGHFSVDPLEIVISRRLCERGETGEAERTLRHEMVHLWQYASGRHPGHGADFRERARLLGISPRATRDVLWRSR
jgi:hypothetical protein